MEEIEYLEEYEDLVLPALNSAAAASTSIQSSTTKSNKNFEGQKTNDGGDESSSSLDQDIFNCLFDDNSDDDDEDDYNTYEQDATSSTPKPKTFTAKTSTTTISINRAESNFANKPKSVATVRPTVQNQLYQPKQKKENTIQRSTILTTQQQHQQRPTTSRASTSNSSTRLPVSARKPLSSATASTSKLVSKNVRQPEASSKTSSLVKKFIKRPATIVKPEKIINKDPVEDPLNLDDLSEVGSDNYSLSDISGETYNTISEFDEDESNEEYFSGDNDYEDDDDNISSSSQVIELSNDSSGSRTKLEVLRASTPSPVISDDSDTRTSSFDLKLRKTRRANPYSHAIIIKSVLRKGEKPKLLELLKQNNLLDDSADNDSEEEASVVIDITASKENLSEILGVDTDKCNTPLATPADSNIVVENISLKESYSETPLPTSSVNQDKNKPKNKRLKKMDQSNTSRDSMDSDLSAVEELLEESYAEAMKRLRDMPLSNQEVGAELEIGGEEEVTSIEIVKNPDNNKHSKPGIVIDYDDNPLEEESEKGSKEMSMLELIEMIEKEQQGNEQRKLDKLKAKTTKDSNKNKHKNISNTFKPIPSTPKELVAKPTTSKEITNKLLSDTLPQKEMVAKPTTSKEITNKLLTDTLPQKEIVAKPTTSKEITNNLLSDTLPQKEIIAVSSSSKEDIVKPEIKSSKQLEVVEETRVAEEVKCTPESSTSKPAEIAEKPELAIVNSVSTDSPNTRKKKRFRNLNTPEPSEPTKNKDEINDFIGFEDVEKHTENSKVPVVESTTTEKVTTKVVENSNEKPTEEDSTKSLVSPSGSFKSPTSSHKSLQDKHKETREKQSRDDSKDRSFKESKPKTSRDNSKEKISRENSKDRSSRENSKDRSRDSSKDRSKLNTKDSDPKYHKEHRKSNDSKESSRSRESSKSRDLKHSSDKKDKIIEPTKEKPAADKTKPTVADVKDKKDSDTKKKEVKDNKIHLEKKGDKIQHKNSIEDINKKSSSMEKTPTIPIKDAKNLNKPKESSKVSSSKSDSSCSSSRDSSKDRKDKKHIDTSRKSIDESKKSDLQKKSTSSIDQNKTNKVVTNTGTKSGSDKPVSSTKVSKSDEKHEDKLKSSKKSLDAQNESTKFVKSDVKPNKDNNTNPKTTPQKPIDLKNKTTKDNTIAKNVAHTKTTNQNPDIKTIKEKSNTDLKAAPKQNFDAKSKDSYNKNIKDSTVVKKETPSKTTTQIPDKSNSTKLVSTSTDINKTPKKVTDDKKLLDKGSSNRSVTPKPSDKNMDQNKKSNANANKSINKNEDSSKKSSSVDNKIINKNVDANKKSSADTNKSTNKIEEKKNSTKTQTTQEQNKDTKNIAANKLTKEGSSNSLKVNLKNVKDNAQICDKSKLSPSKPIIKKSNESKEKGTNIKKEDLQKQDSKLSLKSNVEESKSKEIKNKSEDKMSGKSASSDVKTKADEAKAKMENIEKNKTIKPKSDNVSIKKLADPKITGTTEEKKVTSKLEIKEKKSIQPKATTETINTKQCKESVELKPIQKATMSQTDTTKTNESEKSSEENIRETKQQPGASVPDSKPKVNKSKEMSAKNIESKQLTKVETKTDSTKETKESIKPCDKKEGTKLSKENELQIETESLENISTKEDESEKTKTKTLKIPNKTEESVVKTQDESKNIETKMSNEESLKQETSKNAETKEITKDVSISEEKSEIISSVVIMGDKTETENSISISETPKDAQQTDETFADIIEKQELNDKIENPIQPRITRSRAENSKNNENIDGEPEENILKPVITRKRLNNSVTESTVDLESGEQNKTTIKTKNSIEIKTEQIKQLKDEKSVVELIEGKTLDEKCKEKVEKDILSTKAKDEEELKISEEKSPGEDKSQATEPMKSEKLPPIKAEEVNTKSCELSLSKANTTDQKQEQIDEVKTEVLKEDRKDIKSDTKMKESQSATTVEEITTTSALKKEINESNILPMRTRKRVVMKVDGKKSVENTAVGEEEQKGEKHEQNLEPVKTTEGIVEKNKASVEKPNNEHLEEIQTKSKESTELSVKDKTESKDQIKHAEEEKSKEGKQIESSDSTKHADENKAQDCEGTEENNVVMPLRTRKRTDVKKQTDKVDKVQSKNHKDVENTEEKSAMEVKEKDNFEPILTRKHGDVKAQESTEQSVEDKTESKEKDNFEPILTRKRGEVKVQESTEQSAKDKTESKNPTSGNIVETKSTGKPIEKSKVLEARDSDDSNFEPIRTRKRAEAKVTAGADELTSNIQANEETIETATTKKRAEETKEIDEVKAVKDITDNIRTRKRVEVTEMDLKQISGQDEKNVPNEAKEEEIKLTAGIESEKTDDNKIEPMRTRKRIEAKADNLKQTESTELSSKEHQIKEDIIEPIKTRKHFEETNKTTDESCSEPVRTRKRTHAKSDDLNKKEEARVSETQSKSLSEKQQLQNADDKTVEDNFEPIRTRKRVELKADDFNATVDTSMPKENTESNVTQSISLKDNERENVQVEKDKISDLKLTEKSNSDAEAEIVPNSSNIATDNREIKRILRKRGSESPFSENDNKKIFKEPSSKSVVGTTPKSSAKLEKPLTNVTITTLKRSLRSPVSEPESPNNAKRLKLEIPRKTTRFRNLHDDCLEEEELPVITAGTSSVVNELDDFNVEPKETKVQENVQSAKKLVRKDTLERKTTEKLNKPPSQPVFVIEKTAEKQIKLNKDTAEKKGISKEEEKTIENAEKTDPSHKKTSTNAEANNKAKAVNNEKSLNNEKVETKKQNAPEQNKIEQSKIEKTPNKPSGVSSVLSFSDWLKTKENPTVVDDNSVQSSNTSEVSNIKTKGKNIEKAKPISKVFEVVTTSQDSNKQQSEEANKPQKGNQQKQAGKKVTQEEQESLNSSTTTDTSQLQPSEENAIELNKIDNKMKASKKRNANKKSTNKQNKAETSNVTEETSKISQLDAQENKMKSSTPTQAKQKNKKSEIDLLIESMSKEMKEGGISDLLNAGSHVKRQRLSSKRNITGSTEHLNTTKEPTATTTVGSVLSKEIPKVIDFSDNAETDRSLGIITRELSKSPNKRKVQQNITKSNQNKDVGHKITTETVVQDKLKSTNANATMSIKLRKSLNPKELTAHNKTGETLSSSIITKSRKSLPQTKVSNLDKIASAEEKLPPQSKAHKSEQSSAKTDAEENVSKIFKAPKPIIQSSILNLIPNQENIAKLYADESKRPQSRIKTKSTNALKIFKCRNVKIRLNRSKVQKYLSTLNEHNKTVTTPTETTLQSVTEPAAILENSSLIPTNDDSNLRIQSVVNTADLMDLSTDFNPNNVFVPQDSFIQTSTAPSTMHLDTTLPASIAPVSVPVADQSYAATQVACDTMASLPIINAVDPNEHIELKHEFMDENPIDLVNEALLPDTPTLLARAQTVTEAAQHALSCSATPTDIRLLNTESTENAFVPSFGVTPTALDNRGTCMYTFLHPAKYNRNHSNVLLDYCCPNLDGPMPAIDPTRIHAQVQIPVIELPASIVLTTKIVTRADLEREGSNIPAIIRKKAEKIRNNLAAHHKVASAASATSSTQFMTNITQTHLSQSSVPRLSLPPTINALTKQLPSTTTITPKIIPPQHQESIVHSNQLPSQATTASTLTTIPNIPSKVVSVIPKGPPTLNTMQKSSLRSNLRRFDVLLKQLVQPFDSLSFVDRHRVIESIIATGKIMPKDLDRTIALMEEYVKQTNLLHSDKINKTTSTAPIPLPSTTEKIDTNNYHLPPQSAKNSNVVATIKMPQLQPSPNLLASTSCASSSSSSLYCRQQLEQLQKTTVKKVQTTNRNTSTNMKEAASSVGAVVKQRQVPIYDTQRNIIGYQMKILTPMPSMPAYTKSTMSTHTGTIMSTSLDSSSNKITSYSTSKRPVKRPAQDSPRVFYTTPPLQASTPKAITNPTHVYPTSTSKQNISKSVAQRAQKGSIVTTLRSAGSTSSSGNSETITTTTMATVKRVTRSTATGSKIIIVSKSNQSSEETILPDTNNQQPEIKNEKDIDDFIG